jgi:multiple sugar transport system permease protein
MHADKFIKRFGGSKLHSKVTLRRIGLYGIVVLGAVISLMPFLTMIFISLKPVQSMFATPMWLPPTDPTFANYTALFQGSTFTTAIFTTVVVMVAVTAGQVVFSTLAAYAFARMRFRGRDILFWAYLSTLMIPSVVTLIPLFLVMKQLGWVNTLLGIAGPYIFGTPFGIFLARQFFLGFPRELEEAARLDGAGDWTIFWRIVLPISRPILVTLVIITSVQSWNNFLWPLIIGGTPGTTVLTVAIASLSGAVNPMYGSIMAAAVFVIIPILIVFLVFQRYIINSIQLTGFK